MDDFIFFPNCEYINIAINFYYYYLNKSKY
jgi:hypothetical protein